MASFLLLPGEALLCSDADDLEWIDPQAAALLGPLADDLRQRGSADSWPALAERIETLEPLLPGLAEPAAGGCREA